MNTMQLFSECVHERAYLKWKIRELDKEIDELDAMFERAMDALNQCSTPRIREVSERVLRNIEFKDRRKKCLEIALGQEERRYRYYRDQIYTKEYYDGLVQSTAGSH